MNIVKLLRESSSQRPPNKRYSLWIKKNRHLLASLLLATLLGTYLDLYFVGKGLYSFPLRPFSSVFSINIAFTLFGLPLLVGVFLYVCRKIHLWEKIALACFLSLFMSVIERQVEALGLFVHHESWKHVYSLLGYFLYFNIISLFYSWFKDV